MRLSIKGGIFAVNFAEPHQWHVLPLEAGPVACPVLFLPGIALSGEM